METYQKQLYYLKWKDKKKKNTVFMQYNKASCGTWLEVGTWSTHCVIIPVMCGSLKWRPTTRRSDLYLKAHNSVSLFQDHIEVN